MFYLSLGLLIQAFSMSTLYQKLTGQEANAKFWISIWRMDRRPRWIRNGTCLVRHCRHIHP